MMYGDKQQLGQDMFLTQFKDWFFLSLSFGFLASSSILPSLSFFQTFGFQFKIMILLLEYLFIFTHLACSCNYMPTWVSGF